jgi:hypothetical protein
MYAVTPSEFEILRAVRLPRVEATLGLKLANAFGVFQTGLFVPLCA